MRSSNRTFWAFVVATLGYVMLVSAGGATYARLRTPVIPLLALLAALGIRYWVTRLRHSRPSFVPRHDRLAATTRYLSGP